MCRPRFERTLISYARPSWLYHGMEPDNIPISSAAHGNTIPVHAKINSFSENDI